MKRLIALIVSSAFALGLGIALLSSPAVAVGHPGNTCNPAAGHGRSGCHRVAVSSSSSPKTQSHAAALKAAAAKRAAVQKRAAAARSAAARKKAAAKPVATATAPSVTGTAPASLVPLHPAAPRLPWWLQVWHFLFG